MVDWSKCVVRMTGDEVKAFKKEEAKKGLFDVNKVPNNWSTNTKKKDRGEG